MDKNEQQDTRPYFEVQRLQAENERYRSALSAVISNDSFRSAKMIAQDALEGK